MVYLPARDTRGGRPVRADPLRHHAPGRALRLPPGGQQSLHRHPSLPGARDGERFLSEQELVRLALVLDGHEERHPCDVAFIRLLLLTGCRKSEILTLAWSDYREGHLFLPDGQDRAPDRVAVPRPPGPSSTGFRAGANGSFPRHGAANPLSPVVFEIFWGRVRKEAGIADVRLHDLRHTYASIAVMRGESVTTTGRLLGHNDVRATLKYTHLSDRSVREATDALAVILGKG